MGDGLRALLVPVGLDLYAAPMDAVREVARAPNLTRLLTDGAIGLCHQSDDLMRAGQDRFERRLREGAGPHHDETHGPTAD